MAESNIEGIADGMGEILKLMESLEMNTDSYREQLLSTTGEITTDIFDIGVIAKLLLGWWQALVDLISGGELRTSALVEFWGTEDKTGQEVYASGELEVNFANWAD